MAKSSDDIKFYTQYDTPKDVSITFNEPSLTEQCYKDECSIDFIVANYVKTGIDPNEGKKMSYIDCTTVQDFESAQNLIAETKSMFYDLPATIRDEFQTIDNYLEYVSNPANLKDSYERNLIDQSSVDLKDVYPERYSSSPELQETLQTTTVVEDPVSPTPEA